jgi:hypothetical protein
LPKDIQIHILGFLPITRLPLSREARAADARYRQTILKTTKKVRAHHLCGKGETIGVLHCQGDEPAVETPLCRIWIKEGVYHRVGKPAVETTFGLTIWYYRGRVHRVGGPAVVFKNVKKKSFDRFSKLLLSIECSINHVSIVNYRYYRNAELWFKHDLLHRLDGPAIDVDGEQFWYRNNKKHRIGGPAAVREYITYIDQTDQFYTQITEEWWNNGKLHKTDGPARIRSCSNNMKFEEWYQHGLLHRLDGPAIDEPGLSKWYRYGKLHRLDGPAVVNTADVYELWFHNNKLHRIGGPALVSQANQEWRQIRGADRKSVCI